MCGIFGYVGKNNAVQEVLKGLKKVEYRGYDSAGIAYEEIGKIQTVKQPGKISVLESKLDPLPYSHTAVAHTRWATHGEASETNAHPHFDQKNQLALVHNGIIENYQNLKSVLLEKGIIFTSETDSEVIAQLLGDMEEKDILVCISSVMEKLEGAYAVVLIHADYPGELIAFCNHAPLVIGIGYDEMWVSSDPNALPKEKLGVVFLQNGEIARISPKECLVMDLSGEVIRKDGEEFDGLKEEASKGDFEHYTLKEIFEQPQAIQNALQGRLIQEYGTASFEEIRWGLKDLHTINSVVIIGCGSSLHAGMIGAKAIENLARIPCQVEISSEFRYQNPIVQPNTLVIAISQSGETADTLAAMREMHAKGAQILALCNVPGSTMAREAEECIFLKAGQEVGVCSTKAFSNQVVVLILLALFLARTRHLSKEEGKEIVQGLLDIPKQLNAILSKTEEIALLAEKYANFEEFFFLGRQYMYPTALEGALKLKEISYINSNGYPAGEMKHGPIALIDSDCPTMALMANATTYTKMVSNIMEVRARKGAVIAVVFEDLKEGLEECIDVITIPRTKDLLAPILSSVVCQLFAYYIAYARGADIDKPRNLAKSVTVE